MIHTSTSTPYNLYRFVENVPRSTSFCDFHTLVLSGTMRYTSYGLFLLKHPNASRIQRRQAIKYFYCNKI